MTRTLLGPGEQDNVFRSFAANARLRGYAFGWERKSLHDYPLFDFASLPDAIVTVYYLAQTNGHELQVSWLMRGGFALPVEEQLRTLEGAPEGVFTEHARDTLSKLRFLWDRLAYDLAAAITAVHSKGSHRDARTIATFKARASWDQVHSGVVNFRGHIGSANPLINTGPAAGSVIDAIREVESQFHVEQFAEARIVAAVKSLYKDVKSIREAHRRIILYRGVQVFARVMMLVDERKNTTRFVDRILAVRSGGAPQTSDPQDVFELTSLAETFVISRIMSGTTALMMAFGADAQKLYRETNVVDGEPLSPLVKLAIESARKHGLSSGFVANVELVHPKVDYIYDNAVALLRKHGLRVPDPERPVMTQIDLFHAFDDMQVAGEVLGRLSEITARVVVEDIVGKVERALARDDIFVRVVGLLRELRRVISELQTLIKDRAAEVRATLYRLHFEDIGAAVTSINEMVPNAETKFSSDEDEAIDAVATRRSADSLAAGLSTDQVVFLEALLNLFTARKHRTDEL